MVGADMQSCLRREAQEEGWRTEEAGDISSKTCFSQHEGFLPTMANTRTHKDKHVFDVEGIGRMRGSRPA